MYHSDVFADEIEWLRMINLYILSPFLAGYKFTTESLSYYKFMLHNKPLEFKNFLFSTDL